MFDLFEALDQLFCSVFSFAVCGLVLLELAVDS